MNEFGELAAGDFLDELEQRERFISNSDLPGMGNYYEDGCQQFDRSMDLHSLVFLLALRHFGARPSTENLSVASKGADLTQVYFGHQWVMDGSSDEDIMKRTEHNRNLPWFASTRNGLLLSLLARRLDVMTKIANWVEAWMVPEPAAIAYEPKLGSFYLVLLADFRTIDFPGIEEVEQSLAKSRKKAPKLLYAVWQAVRQEDQQAFDAAIKESIDHFEKTAEPPMSPYDCIALDQSIVLAAARYRGMNLTELTELQQARVITHESLGLPAPNA